jgi:hypothetical protein
MTSFRFGLAGVALGALSTVCASAASPNLRLSAEFSPIQVVAKDAGQRDRFAGFLQSQSQEPGDTGKTFAIRGPSFRLSRRWANRLSAEADATGPSTEKAASRNRRHQARQWLEQEFGTTFENPVYAFPAGYLPGEASLIYTATPAEESNVGCRQKPMWPYLESSVICGDTTGSGINIAPVWERFDGSDTLVIAVLDAGFDFLHPELQGRFAVNAAEANGAAGVDDDGNGFVDDIRGWDFVDSDNDAQDYNGHGTMTSGVIAAGFDNGIGIPGMLPRVKILPVRVLSTAGFGNADSIAAGILYAVDRGAHVINFSIGINSTGTHTGLRNAFIAARDAGVIVAAASGNSALNLDVNARQPFSYNFANVYSIGAHDPLLNLSGYSNYGATKVDLAAPGDHIVTTGIPPALGVYAENFETFSGSRWSFTGGTWQAATDTMEGTKSLRWVSGTNTTLTLDSIDLRGKRGGLLKFRLSLLPANSRDGLDVFALPAGSSDPILIGGTGTTMTNEVISINLGDVDNTLFKILFRTCVYNTLGTACSGTASAAGRVLRIDDVRITHADLDSTKHNVVTVTGGTSLAAPFFAGYAGLMRLASDRMNVPLTRSLMLAGVKVDSKLSGKVATSGRLDVAKGLDFYVRTLPRIRVNDSLDTAWSTGADVAYALTVRDSLGPRNDFAFSPISLPPGGTLSGNGSFAWNAGLSPQGAYAVRAKATNGVHTLRSLTTFTIGAATTIRAGATEPSRLRVGGKVFLLPSHAFDAAGQTHALRVELYGPDGKTLQKLDGVLTLPSGARLVDYQLTGVRGVGVRAWLNGVVLQSARD